MNRRFFYFIIIDIFVFSFFAFYIYHSFINKVNKDFSYLQEITFNNESLDYGDLEDDQEIYSVSLIPRFLILLLIVLIAITISVFWQKNAIYRYEKEKEEEIANIKKTRFDMILANEEKFKSKDDEYIKDELTYYFPDNEKELSLEEKYKNFKKRFEEKKKTYNNEEKKEEIEIKNEIEAAKIISRDDIDFLLLFKNILIYALKRKKISLFLSRSLVMIDYYSEASDWFIFFLIYTFVIPLMEKICLIKGCSCCYCKKNLLSNHYKKKDFFERNKYFKEDSKKKFIDCFEEKIKDYQCSNGNGEGAIDEEGIIIKTFKEKLSFFVQIFLSEWK